MNKDKKIFLAICGFIAISTFALCFKNIIGNTTAIFIISGSIIGTAICALYSVMTMDEKSEQKERNDENANISD